MKRQGDLLIVPVKKIPENVVKNNGLVLAEGEATGHKHELDSGELFESHGTLYFDIKSSIATLKHEEHGTVTFEPGQYKVIKQREYVTGAWRDVKD